MPLPIGNLNISLKDIDTSYPSLAVADYPMEIKKYEFKESSKTPGMWMFILILAVLEPAQDCKGKELPLGWETTARLTLPGAPGAVAEHEDMRNKSLASLLDAVFHTSLEAGDRPDFNEQTCNALIGKKVIACVKKNKPDKDTGEVLYGETDVKSFKPLIQG